MKLMRVGILGIFLLLSSLACGLFGNTTPNVAPTVTLVPLVPTVPPSLPTQGANTQVFTISENELNQQLNQNLQNAPLSNVVLDFHAGNTANVRATLRVNELTLQPNLSIRIAVSNGRITIDVTDVNVGGFGVPRSMIEPQIQQVKEMAEREFNSLLAKMEGSTGLKLQAVSTTENELRLYFAP